MQVFTGPTTAEWGLHMFAISTDRNQQQAQAMAYRYNVQAREYVDVAEYILRFDDLKVKLLTLIRVYILTYLKAKSWRENRISSQR